MLLFTRLLDLLFPLRDTERIVRETTQTELGRLLSPAHIDREGRKVITLLPYRRALVHALIVEAKYKGNERAWHILAEALAAYLFEWCLEEAALSPVRFVMVPVPLGTQRKRERGYNQTERICAGALLHLTEVPITLDTALLVRSRDTLPQTSLGGRARRENMQGAFRTTSPLDPSVTYIVIDDVLTTGATLKAAGEALEAAGAQRVIALAFAH